MSILSLFYRWAMEEGHAEAEPLLLKAYEGMKQREKTIPAQFNNARLGSAANHSGTVAAGKR